MAMGHVVVLIKMVPKLIDLKLAHQRVELFKRITKI